MRALRAAGAILGIAALATQLSCQKDDEAAEKFERADQSTFRREMSELSSFTLANGISVYLQEEHTTDQVAVEVLYPVGFMDEPKGRPQLSHLTEHLTVYCGSGPFGIGEAHTLLTSERGRFNAETLGDLIHFDYIVRQSRFEDVLRVEAARMTDMTCDDATLTRERDKVANEIDQTLANPKNALTKYAMMALNQAMNHGQRYVEVHHGADRVTVADARQFLQQHFRPDEMVIVIIGNLKKAEAEPLIRKHLESIPRRPAFPAPVPRLSRDVSANWDVKAGSLYYVSPGPYADYRERLILTCFGSYLNQFMNAAPDLYTGNQIIYCTNHVYRVGDVPFFIFCQPGTGRTVGEVGPLLLQYLDRAVALLDDDSRVAAIKAGAMSFMTSTTLKVDVPDYPMSHHQVIGQEALNIGLKHFLREGRTGEEFAAEIDAITPDEFRAVIKRRMTRDRLFEVTFTPRK